MAIFKNLSDNFKELTTQLFGGWTAQTDPALMSQMQLNASNDKKTINSQLITKFFEISSTKSGIIKDIDSIKEFYFSQLIINRILDDALNPTGNDNRLFKAIIYNKNGEIDESATNLLDEFVDEFNLQKMIIDIASDLLFYGEYYLRLDVNSINDENFSKKGIINIHDDVEMENVIPIFRDSDVSYYLKLNKKKIETISPSSLVYFSLPSSRIRIKIDGLDDKIAYLRMGKSVLYPVYGLLKELKFLENIIPINFINNASATKLVSVTVPSTTKPMEAQKIAKTFEGMINNTLRSNSSGKTDDEVLSELQNSLGNVKVIPNFGDKGELNSEDFNSEDKFEDIQEKVGDLRKMILTTIGIPSSIIDEEGLKSDVIKDHVRYTKKLKSIQFALKEGLQRIFIVHLINNGFDNFIKEDIKVQFLNVLNTDDLEKLEFLDLTVSMLDNFKSFVEDFEDNDKIKINMPEYIKFMNAQFESNAGFQIFELKDEDEQNSDGGY